ncbi:MAG: DinB family protein [Winogradskyella sp.]|nr:DinB family protein [Winogradskyella sp.]
MISNLLNQNEYNPYYTNYINLAPSTDIVKGLEQNLEFVVLFYESIPPLKHDYSYAQGKWTIKDILLHSIDTERIFVYRALRIARRDQTPLPGFEQDDYVLNGQTKARSLNSLLEEYKSVRQASISLYKSFDLNTLIQVGKASGFPISVRALGYIITGHENHHNQIIQERYL